jgi:hypothetical protein
MSEPNPGLMCTTAPATRVLAARRILKDQAAIRREIASLRPQVAGTLTGPPICRVIGTTPEGEYDVELAFPITGDAHLAGFDAKTLPAMPSVSYTHTGPLRGESEESTFPEAWGKMIAFIRERKLLLGDDPSRYVYHEGRETHGEDSARYVTELLIPYHLPVWLAALEQGVHQAAGPDAALKVMEGSAGLAEALDGDRAARWVQAATARLDEAVPDELVRARILNACAHHYLIPSAERLQKAYEEVGGDLRKLVAKINGDEILGGKYWIEESSPEPLLWIERAPARKEAYEQATDPAEKRYQACFCPLVRDAIRSGEKVSRTFCHCSAGWYVQEWEPILGERPRVKLVRTMLEGADSCLFAVHIPEGLL